MASLLTAAFLLGILSLAALMVWQNYRAALGAGEARALSSAHVVASHIEWMIEASDQALRRIDTVFNDSPVRSSADTIVDIAEAVSDLPSDFQYSVYDETGRLRLSSVSDATGINISDRDYFREVRNSDRTIISPQLEERQSGQAVFVIARRILRDGEFHGAASIAIPVSKLVESWRSMGFGANSTISLVRSDGWLVARYPEVPNTVNLRDAVWFSTYLPQNPSGFYHSPVSPVDGMSRIVGYWTVDQWPLVATAAIERGETLALFWSTLKSESVFMIPVLILLVAGCVSIIALLRAYARRNQELEVALERNNTLFREIHHRVKNNLQAVAALIRLQPIPDETRNDMARRIAAMIAVHEQIYQSDQFDRVEVAPYVNRLILEIANAYNRDVVIETKLDSVAVSRDQALPVGLIVNEVVSNAFKYAFADRGHGRLEVVLSEEGDMASLTIRDDGPGIDPGSARKGMGSRLIAGFVAQLGGKYSMQADGGTVFTMTVPIR